MIDDGRGHPVFEDLFDAGLVPGAGSVKEDNGVAGGKPEDRSDMVGFRSGQLGGFACDISWIYEESAEAHRRLWLQEEKCAPFPLAPGFLMFQAKSVVSCADVVGLGAGQDSC